MSFDLRLAFLAPTNREHVLSAIAHPDDGSARAVGQSTTFGQVARSPKHRDFAPTIER